jgi:hypothetical protein
MRTSTDRWRLGLLAAVALMAATAVSCDPLGNGLITSPPSPPPPPRQYVEVRVQGGAHLEASRTTPPRGQVAYAFADALDRALLSLPGGTFALTATTGNGLAGRADLVIPPGSGTIPDTARVTIVLGPRAVIRGRALLNGAPPHDYIEVITAEASYAIGASADTTGDYALTVPPGTWTVIFNGPGVPSESLTVTVAEFGDTLTLPTITLGDTLAN